MRTALPLVVLVGQLSVARADEAPSPPPYTLGAYAEAFYQWNFNQPSNGLTNFRGFDNRHNTFTISNVALDAQWDVSNVFGRATLQVGHTPSTYYLAEPSSPGSSGANASGAELWKYVQQAYVGYRFAKLKDLAVTGGLFLSPIGPETIAIHDNWTWSRSTPFFGLPYYHVGLRLSLPVTPAWTVTLAGYNGWNSVVDNNAEKSLALHATWTRAPFALSLLYFTGVERPTGAPEGRPWRHLFDAHLTWDVTERVSLLFHADTGFEPNAFGVSSWVAGAAYARVRLVSMLWAVARVDGLFESVPAGASPLFFPVPWVVSGTATLDFRPHERVSVRLEFRHDHAAGPLYFAGNVTGDGVSSPFVPNAAAQNTLTAGVTTWF